MEKLHFAVDIKAPASKVFNAVTDKQSYKKWTVPFMEGSTFEGGWNKGDKILFLVDTDGKREGMVAKITENIPNKQISIKHQGMLEGDKEVTEGPLVEGWAGAMEEYFLDEKNGVTTFKVSVDTMPDHIDYFQKAWPQALDKLKEISEN